MDGQARPRSAPAGAPVAGAPPSVRAIAPRPAAAPVDPAAPAAATDSAKGKPISAPAGEAKATDPPMAIATTGIAGLDAQLGGGIPRGTTLLIIGEPGNAIPLFSEQFAGGGLDAGEDVHFFELDRPCGAIRQGIRSFVLRGNLDKAELTLYDGYSPQFGQGSGGKMRDPNGLPVTAGEAPQAVLAALQNQTAGRPYRLVVETLSALARPDNEREIVDFVRNLVYLGHEMDGLHLISIVKGLHSPWLETQLRHLATGVIEFGAERKGFGIYNYLIVSKLLEVRDPVRILLWKETEKGLWLESTKRVF